MRTRLTQTHTLTQIHTHTSTAPPQARVKHATKRLFMCSPNSSLPQKQKARARRKERLENEMHNLHVSPF